MIDFGDFIKKQFGNTDHDVTLHTIHNSPSIDAAKSKVAKIISDGEKIRERKQSQRNKSC